MRVTLRLVILAVVGTVCGAAPPDELDRAATAEAGALGLPGLHIYSDEIFPTPFDLLVVGFDRSEVCTENQAACTTDSQCSGINNFCGAVLDTLAPGTETNAWDLVCAPGGGGVCQASSWDFSSNNLTNYPAMTEFGTTTVLVNSNETCSHCECGFNDPGAVLTREDRGFANPSTNIPTLNAVEFQDRSPADHTIWLRGTVRNEGVTSGGLGKNESRICYEENSVVPLWQFQHCDAEGCYMQLGDAWAPEGPSVFDCQQNLFNAACSEPTCPTDCGLFCALYAYACTGFAGEHRGEVVNEGLVTLPSGHTFKALVVESTAEFCVALFSSCGNATQRVRTVNYLWAVPNVGTVVRLQSRTLADSVQDFNPGADVVAEMDIKFGLFPPRSVTVTGTTDTTVGLSWDPGLVTHRIHRYRVYWDTDSGSSTPYAFDSVANAGQVTFAGPSATIAGLSSATTYFFTVTAVYDYTDPASGVVTTYESLLFPERIPASPVDLPVEVSAATTGGGADAGAVPNGDDRPGPPLRLGKAGGDMLDLTWDDSCIVTDTHYHLYEGVLGTPGSHVPLPSDPCAAVASTAAAIAPSPGNRYYLVVPANAGAEGSYGIDSMASERPASGSACAPQSLGAPVCP